MWPGALRSLRDPALRGRLERHTGGDRLDLAQSPTRFGARCKIIEVSHSQACPIRSCTIEGSTWCGLAPQEPVGRRQQQQVVPLPVALAGLEDRLLRRHDVAPVAVQEHDRRKPCTTRLSPDFHSPRLVLFSPKKL